MDGVGTPGLNFITVEYPLKITGLKNITKITTGSVHSLVLQNNTDIFAWGSNSFKQCGDASDVFVVKTPIKVFLPLDYQIKPFELKASLTEDNKIKLEWSSQYNLNEILGYNLYRSYSKDMRDATLLTDFVIKDNFYTDTVSDNQTYYYICKAVIKPNVEIEQSNIININVPKINEIILQIGNPYMSVGRKTIPIDPESTDTMPVIISGSTLIPIRALIEELGGTVTWRAEDSSIIINYNNNEILLKINDKTALVNGTIKDMNVAPQIINGRTMLPLRFVSENLGLKVVWDSEKYTISITY